MRPHTHARELENGANGRTYVELVEVLLDLLPQLLPRMPSAPRCPRFCLSGHSTNECNRVADPDIQEYGRSVRPPLSVAAATSELLDELRIISPGVEKSPSEQERSSRATTHPEHLDQLTHTAFSLDGRSVNEDRVFPA